MAVQSAKLTIKVGKKIVPIYLSTDGFTYTPGSIKKTAIKLMGPTGFRQLLYDDPTGSEEAKIIIKYFENPLLHSFMDSIYNNNSLCEIKHYTIGMSKEVKGTYRMEKLPTRTGTGREMTVTFLESEE